MFLMVLRKFDVFVGKMWNFVKFVCLLHFYMKTTQGIIMKFCVDILKSIKKNIGNVL